MKKSLFVLIFGSMVTFAGEPMLASTPFAKVLQEIPKHKKTFIEVGSEHCHSCQEMGKLLYRIKREYPDYPIYFVDVSKEREVAYKMGVQMIPTQIVVDSQGNQIYRHIGFLKRQSIIKVLQ